MHLLIGFTIIIFHIGMLIYRPCRIYLKTVDAIVYEFCEMIHPMLHSALRPSVSLSNQILFGQAEIIVGTEPETEFEAHTMQPSY